MKQNKQTIFITPTDTVLGIGCHYQDMISLAKIYQLKKRPIEKKIIICIGALDQIEAVIGRAINQTEKSYIEKYWPGQVTFLFVNNQNQKIGIRLPKHDKLQAYLIDNGPAFLTSLNISGQSPIIKISEIPKEFSKIKIISNQDALNNPPSTIYDLESHKLIRQGKVTIDN